MLKCQVLPLFCSNPDALGIDESEKGIFGSLKSIAQLPPSPSKDGDRLGDTAAGMAESPAAEGASKDSPVADTGEWLYEVYSTGFLSCFC